MIALHLELSLTIRHNEAESISVRSDNMKIGSSGLYFFVFSDCYVSVPSGFHLERKKIMHQ